MFQVFFECFAGLMGKNDQIKVIKKNKNKIRSTLGPLIVLDRF